MLKRYSNKKGNSDGATGSKSKMDLMKSNQNTKKEAGLKKQKEENAPDTISKSFKKCPKGSGD